MNTTNDDPYPPVLERSVPLPTEDDGPPSLEDKVSYLTFYFTDPASSIGRVSTPGNGSTWVQSHALTYHSLEMVIAAPRLALRLAG